MALTIQEKVVMGVLLLFVIGLPFLNQIIHWNESVSFPSSMAGIESVLREMENNALKSTEILLSTSSVGGLISGILIIGVLTGLDILVRLSTYPFNAGKPKL